MVSVTLSIPEDVREKMKTFDEVNWSGFIREQIKQKVEKLSRKQDLLQQLETETEFNTWAVNLVRKGRQ